ncbi:MAG: tetratricopeptide repeat protein [Terriglobales bacterium]
MTHRLFVLLLLCTCPVAAQLDNGLSNRARSVRVRVVFPSGGACDSQTHVSLLSGGGVAFGEASIHGDCTVEFANVPNGTYHLTVAGPGGNDSGSETFEVGTQDTQDFEVRVNPLVKSDGKATQGGALVPASELNIPKKAKKEFARASDSMAVENWPQAIERLNQAITIYPQFVDAYNNLGVVYARLGDRAHERDVLQKAISLDDHYAPAYVNLARADIAEQNFSHAEVLLDKANAIDPTDVITLVLLANVELRTRHFDQVIDTSRRAHSTKRPQHSLVHYIAALAYEQQSRPADALAELKVFLKEEVDGPRAAAARKEMAALRAVVH